MSGMVLKQELGLDNVRRAVLSDISKGKPTPQVVQEQKLTEQNK